MKEGFYFMKNVVLKEICKDLKWRERITIRIFGKLFYYVYKKGMTDCFKYYNK